MSASSKRNIAYGAVNIFLIIVHNKHTPADEEWNAYVAYCNSHFADQSSMRTLVVPDGGPDGLVIEPEFSFVPTPASW